MVATPDLEKQTLDLLNLFESLFVKGEAGSEMIVAISEGQALSAQLAAEIALLAGTAEVQKVAQQSRLLTAQSRLIKCVSRAIILTKRARVHAYEEALIIRRERLIS